jgi:glycosyltransferase involved in cell wall biosynthesis
VKTAIRGHVLLIAYHFPPDGASSGRLRTLGFTRYLPAHAWAPVVLSASPRAYERIDFQGIADIPPQATVHRAFALDTQRHLGWRGKYLSWLAAPDRWISWLPGAVIAGRRLIKRHAITAVWSTYPIATSHLIAFVLARATGLPWIADFRDPVAPAGSWIQRRAAAWIERVTLAHADRIVFTTPGARARYARAYPEVEAAGRLSVIANGFDEAMFDPGLCQRTHETNPQRITLVHSGLLYPEGRNPAPFFAAIAQLKKDQVISKRDMAIVLRASGHEAEYQAQIDRLDIADLVRLAPAIAYREALAEQAVADGLLLFQGPEFNIQIPAKAYEYLCLGRPIFALTDTAGDTAGLLQRTGGAVLAPIDDAGAIAAALADFIERVRGGAFPRADTEAVQSYSRRSGAGHLAKLLDTVSQAS